MAAGRGNIMIRLLCCFYYCLIAGLNHYLVSWLFGCRPLLARSMTLAVFTLSPLFAVAQAVDYKNQAITLALSSEPPTLNSLVTTNSVSFFVLGHIMEGLMQYDEHQALVGAVAERWQLREDGVTFWLRKDARWSDGKPVTASDFVFAWRKVVDPKTASQYAFIMYPIKNAEQINRGELAPDQLAVRAVDDYQLEVSFERPCPYFLSLTAFGSYFPLRQDVFEADPQRYAADPEQMLYNGAFTLERWVHGAQLTLVKNQHYWNRQAVHLNRIDMPYITADASAVFNLYQDRRVAMSGLDNETANEAMRRGYPMKKTHTGAQYYLGFNFRDGRVSANLHVRKAIQAIFDPKILVNKVLAVPGNVVGESLFPQIVKGVEGRFRDEYPPVKIERGLELARAHIEKAKQQLGVETLPPLVLLAGDSPRAAKEAEYLQYLLQQGLGLDLRIDSQMFKQYLEKMRRGDYDIAVAGWGPDFDDAITYGDLFASWNANNRGQYHSDEYDRWVRVAQNSADQGVRMNAMAQLQRLVAEDVVIIPTFEAGYLYVQHPQLQGVVRRTFGADPDYKFARVIAKPAEPARAISKEGLSKQNSSQLLGRQQFGSKQTIAQPVKKP